MTYDLKESTYPFNYLPAVSDFHNIEMIEPLANRFMFQLE